jgi:hypothetical protein
MTDLERNNYYNNNNIDIFNQEDMINYKGGGGYSLPSAFALVHKKDTTTKDAKNKVSEEYEHLVIPASLYYMERRCLGEPMMQEYYMNNDNDDEDVIISEDMYDKLLLLAEDKARKQKKYTKNNKKNLYKKSPHKKTRRVK